MHTSEENPWARRFLGLALVGLLLAGSWGWQPPAAAYAQERRLCTIQFKPVSPPLTELGSSLYVRMDGQQTDFSGGLYPGGSNQRPAAHEAAGLAAAARIQALDHNGNPNPVNGKIVLLSVGMSNANMEFEQFIQAAAQEPGINPQLVLVNGAQNGQVAPLWVDANAPTWALADLRLKQAGVTPLQVQAAWVKQTRLGGGDFPSHTTALQSDLEAIAHNLKTRFPNLQIAYFSSRTRSYTTWRGISPEPQAFETGFAVKWMIEKQIQGDTQLNFDSARGEVKAPYLAWGPYLWADGMNPRADGMVWTAEDMEVDCTHPTDSGVAKVVAMLLQFFKSDSTAITWFLADPAQALAPSPTPEFATSTHLPHTSTPEPSSTPDIRISSTPITPTPAAATATLADAAATQQIPTAATTTAPASTPGGLAAGGFLLLAGLLLGLLGLWLRGRRGT